MTFDLSSLLWAESFERAWILLWERDQPIKAIIILNRMLHDDELPLFVELIVMPTYASAYNSVGFWVRAEVVFYKHADSRVWTDSIIAVPSANRDAL